MNVRVVIAWIRSNPVTIVVIALGIYGLLKGMYDIIATLKLVLSVPILQDLNIYIAGGRALLNDINLYEEFFENKPPGIFLVTAASLALTGTQLLTKIFEGLLLIALPVMTIFAAIRWTINERRTWMLAGLLFGLVLVQYVVLLGTVDLQTETVGAVFCCLYMLIITKELRRLRLQILLAGLCCFMAIVMKEPFVIAIIAYALVALRSPKEFFRLLILPLSLAGGLVLLILASFGFLPAYLNVYLPFMTNIHIYSRGSPWSRGWHFERMAGDLLDFAIWMLVIGIIVLAVAILASWKEEQGIPQKFIRIAQVLVALYFTSFAIGLGGQYYPHHFLFIVPLIFAFFVVGLRFISVQYSHLLHVSAFVMTTLASLHLVTHATTKEVIWDAPWLGGPQEQMLRDNAARLDGLMEACGWERYLPYGPMSNLWAYTKHSPYSSLFTTFRMDISHQFPEFGKMYYDQLKKTPLIVFYKEEYLSQIGWETRGAIWRDFTLDAPVCALPFLPVPDHHDGNYTLLYRI